MVSIQPMKTLAENSKISGLEPILRCFCTIPSMPKLSIRLNNKLQDDLVLFAKKNNEPISASLRRLIENGLALTKCQEQHPQATAKPTDESSQEKPELDAAMYKRSFDFMMLESVALLRLIVKKSGKFDSKTAEYMLSTARSTVDKYMHRYEKIIDVKHENGSKKQE